MTALARWAVALAAALPLLAAPARAQDLLTVWRAAAEHDQRLAVARAEHGASQTLREQAEALWRPQIGLQLGLGVGVQDNAMRGAQFSAPGLGTVDEARFATSVRGGLATRVGVQAQQPLVNPGREAQQAQLRGAADMGDTAWRAAQAEFMLRTAKSYFALAVADERVRVTRRQLDTVGRSRTEAHDRYELGAAAITDTHEADAALAGVRAQSAAAELDARVRREQLAGSTGLAQPSARLPGAWADAASPELQQWLLLADADNPRLRLLSQAVTLAEQKQREKDAASRPTLDLVAQAAHQRIAGHGHYGSARSRGLDALVGVQVNIPLYTGGLLSAQEREAAERTRQARAELELAREEVRQQVHAAWQGLQVRAAQVQALQEALVAQRARRDATRLGLEVGDRTTLDLLNADNDLAGAELALALAQVDRVLTGLQLALLADRLDEALLARINASLLPEGQP